MPESEPFDLSEVPDLPPAPPSVRLVIVPDMHDKDWTHFYTPKALTETYDGLPHGLKNRLRSIVNGLVQRQIWRLDYDSSRVHSALVDLESLRAHPFDLRLLKEDTEFDFEDLFAAVNWWIERAQRRFRCGIHSYHNVQAHKTWTCECGEVVDVSKEFMDMCSNPECPTWEKQEFCLGRKISRKKTTLRLA